MEALEFKIQLKDGKGKTAPTFLLCYNKSFGAGHRFVWYTGIEVKRNGFDPALPGKALKKIVEIAEHASIAIRTEGHPLTKDILKQRIDLMVNRISWNKEKTELSIWTNEKAQTFTIPDNIHWKILDEALKRELIKIRPDLNKVVSSFLSNGEDELFGFWLSVLEGRTKPMKEGKTLRPSTISSKRQTYNLVKAYNPRLTFADMTMKFYNEFRAWMEETRVHLPSYPENKYDRNNIGKHFKELKSILHLARKNELNVSDKFTYWGVAKESNEVITLDKQDVQKIKHLELTGVKKDVRDIFIMACFLGPRIGDFPKLVWENFINENGIDFFQYVQEKTGATVKVPILPDLQKFKAKLDPWPKMISEQNFRSNLREICKKAELTDRVIIKIRDGKPEYKKKWQAISPHSARRTFASGLFYGWWSKPLPASFVMRYTGHKSEKSFMKYIGAEGKQLDDKALEILGLTPSMKIA